MYYSAYFLSLKRHDCLAASVMNALAISSLSRLLNFLLIFPFFGAIDDGSGVLLSDLCTRF